MTKGGEPRFCEVGGQIKSLSAVFSIYFTFTGKQTSGTSKIPTRIAIAIQYLRGAADQQMEFRPRIKLPLSRADRVVETASWLILIFLWAWVSIHYLKLPKVIPIHFNVEGQISNYGNKLVIFILPAIATMIFTIMTILNRYPYLFNYPIAINSENALRQYTNSTRMIRYLKLSVVTIFTLIVLFTNRAATGRSTEPGWWFLILIQALIWIPVIYFIRRSFKNKPKEKL
ncbi:MAG TPA: DUF1648 domain-containing protein [Chitinophagaceae bacterium]|jgi:hypothetical protein|nr:DUF1648 domain-containing protein [Chitinophagaceae bacterium]